MMRYLPSLTLGFLRLLCVCPDGASCHANSDNHKHAKRTAAANTDDDMEKSNSSSSSGSKKNNNLQDFWKSVAQSVVQGDFDTYRNFYHADAVYVTETDGTSQPIASKFPQWKRSFDETKQGQRQTTLDFCITKRLSSPTTSHETGIFRYTSSSSSSSSEEEPNTTVVATVHFQSLLWRSAPCQPWQFTMEYQGQPATLAQWEEASASSSV